MSKRLTIEEFIETLKQGSSPAPFSLTVTEDQTTSEITCDRTFDEILSAVQSETPITLTYTYVPSSGSEDSRTYDVEWANVDSAMDVSVGTRIAAATKPELSYNSHDSLEAVKTYVWFFTRLAGEETVSIFQKYHQL